MGPSSVCSNLATRTVRLDVRCQRHLNLAWQLKGTDAMHQNKFTRYAQTVLGFIENLGLVVIVAATVVAGIDEVAKMLAAGAVALADLLQMFLYLEILAMVGLYFQSGKLPVRFPVYIAIVALARYLVLDMKNLDEWRLLGITASILLLAVAVLAIRYGHVRYPYGEGE
jgi:protein PsiE